MNPTVLHILRRVDGVTYLASPYTGYCTKAADPLEEAAQRVAHASGELHALGIPHFCPIAHSHWAAKARGLNPRDHDLWMPHCIAHLKRCSALLILMLPGWQTSKGVMEETRAAEGMGMDVLHMAPTDE